VDADDFRLLLSHLQAQEERLSALLDRAGTGRGAKFLDLARLYIGGSVQVREHLAIQHAAAPSATSRQAIERKTLRLKDTLSFLHIWIVHFSGDVGRRDVPVGLIYIIDDLLTTMHLGDSDALVHIDDNYMYSVVAPVAKWGADFSVCAVTYTDTTNPVIFNLPGTDPNNIVLSPILAHEVGHPCIVEHDLLTAFNNDVDQRVLKPIWDSCVALGASSPQVNTIWSSWVQELLCDALAVAATGPSMLFASLAFLPGPTAGQFGESHPDPAHRIGLTLEYLDSMGWTPALEAAVPDVMTWARHLAAIPVDPNVPPVLNALNDAVPLVRAQLWQIALRVVGQRAFVPNAFADDGPYALSLLEAGITPVERDGQATSAWSIVLATWLFLLAEGGGSPDGVYRAVDNTSANSISLKAIELSGMLRLWRTGDTTPT
jgi:hypothetical protein